MDITIMDITIMDITIMDITIMDMVVVDQGNRRDVTVDVGLHPPRFPPSAAAAIAPGQGAMAK